MSCTCALCPCNTSRWIEFERKPIGGASAGTPRSASRISSVTDSTTKSDRGTLQANPAICSSGSDVSTPESTLRTQQASKRMPARYSRGRSRNGASATGPFGGRTHATGFRQTDTAHRRQAVEGRAGDDAAQRQPARCAHRDAAHGTGIVRFSRRRQLALRGGRAARAVEPRLWRRNLLSFLPHETGGQAHLRGLHRHGVLHQGRQPDPRLDPAGPRHQARRDNRRRAGLRC